MYFVLEEYIWIISNFVLFEVAEVTLFDPFLLLTRGGGDPPLESDSLLYDNTEV